MIKSTRWQKIYRTIFPWVFSNRRNGKVKFKNGKELGYLLRINQRILSQEKLPPLLQYIVGEGARFLQADAATLRLVDAEHKFLLLKVATGALHSLNPSPLPLNKKGITGSSFLKATSIICPHISNSYLSVGDNPEVGEFTSLLTVPLKTDSKVLGVLSLYSKKKRVFTPLEVRTAEIFASQATLAIVKTSYIQKIGKVATMEKMTGLYNQSYFYQRLEEEIAKASRSKCSLSLLFMDTDRLKDINDTYGHLVGDKVLQLIARSIKESIRKMDIAFRYGGDEFVVILPHAGSKEATLVAERIRKKTEGKTPFPPVSLSFGVASFPQDATEARELLDNADRAMYQTKQGGRNNIEK